jgi:hypothetical protein
MKDMKTDINENKIMRAMRSSRGQFFGLTTTQGNTINGRFVSETARYVRVFDRNRNANLTIAKTSLASIRCNNVLIG